MSVLHVTEADINRHALEHQCPDCGAKPGVRCRIAGYVPANVTPAPEWHRLRLEPATSHRPEPSPPATNADAALGRVAELLPIVSPDNAIALLHRLDRAGPERR